ITDSLGDDGGDVALLFQNIFQVIGASQVADFATTKRASHWFRRRRMFASGKQRPDALTKCRLATDGNGIEGCAVKRIPERDEFETASGHTSIFQGHADRAGPAGSQ